MWAWVFEMTDEEVAVAQAEMEHLAPQPTQKTAQIETLLQQFELSFQKKVESLTKDIEKSVKKNEDLLKKQVKALTDQHFDRDPIEQIKRLLEQVEKTFNEKVDKLAKKIEQSSSDNPPTSAVTSEVNLEGALRQLDELEKLLSRKLEITVQTINQFVSDAIEDVEKDLKNQIATLRRQLGVRGGALRNTARGTTENRVKNTAKEAAKEAVEGTAKTSATAVAVRVAVSDPKGRLRHSFAEAIEGDRQRPENSGLRAHETTGNSRGSQRS